MFQTTSDQQAQSSVIVVSSSSSSNSSSSGGGGGSGLSIINNTSLVGGNVCVDGAINAFNDAIDHQSHHHHHLNTIFSSYFNCKNQHLIEFPQFHHHHHHVHTYNLNLNFNNFHTPSSSSSVSSQSTNTSNNNSNSTEASIILDTIQKISKEIKPSPSEEIDKINHNLSSLNPFNSANETGSKLTNKKETESNTNKLMELDKCLIKSKDEETPKEIEESIEIDNNNNSICLVKPSSSSKLEVETMPHAIAFNLKRNKNKTNQKKTNSLIDISTSVKSKILIQLKKVPKRLGLRKRRKTTELYDSNNTSSCSSNSSCNILRRRKRKSTNQTNNKNKYTNKEQNNLTASLPTVNTRIHFTRSQTRASQSNTIDKHNNNNNLNNVDTKGKKSSTKSLKSKILNGVTKRLKKNALDEIKKEDILEGVERRLKKSQPNLTSILLLDEEDDYEQFEENTKEFSASSSAIASSSLINHDENLINNNVLQTSNEKSIPSNNIQDTTTNSPNVITEICNEQNQPNNEQHFYDQTQNLIQNQQFIYDIEMMPQQVHQQNHQQQLLQPNLNQLLIDESRSSSIYSLFNAATTNNNNQIKQDLLKLSYDKFKQFRLNEKLLQQTVLIRNAIKMLQYDIQFQQEQEQQIIIQQQQHQHHHHMQQQQHLMEFSNNNNNNNRTTSVTTPNPSSSPMATNYDNLEDFLTRSEFSNNAMLNHNRTTSQSLPSSTLVLNGNLSNPNNSNQQSVNVNNCYYVITSSNQVQILNNESNVIGEENVDVDGNEEDDEEDEEEEEAEEDDDEDEEDITGEEETDEEDEVVDEFTDEPDEPLFTQMNVVVIKNEKLNQKQFENKENQIRNYLNETKKFSSLKDDLTPVSNIDLTNTHRSSEININNKSDIRGEQEEEEPILIESQLTVNLTLTNENENYLDIKLETPTPPSIITNHANVEDFQNNMNSSQLTKNNTEEFFI